MTPATDPNPDRMLTAWQVARMLNCSRPSVYALRDSGALKSYRLSRRAVRFKAADVLALLDRSRTGEGGGR